MVIIYETVVAPRNPNKLINDPKDSPILNSAIIAEVDIILSGDKHFKQLGLEHPKVMTARDYFDCPRLF
jgi:predicted nucleic acid-binding protein